MIETTVRNAECFVPNMKNSTEISLRNTLFNMYILKSKGQQEVLNAQQSIRTTNVYRFHALSMCELAFPCSLLKN